jgi:DNA repair protein RecN (Recombination protein N)
MLTELRIENFAIIDKLELEFGSGLIIFTGETGAGKSIIMDAVQLLLGGRPDPTFIRADSERTIVEGVFKLNGVPKESVNAILEREELLDDPNYVTLTRELRREGRNIARLNGRTVNAALLREVGAALVDIHGQTEHFSLLDVRAHLSLLDRYASVDQPLAAYRQTYSTLQAVRRELNDIRRLQKDADRRIEMLTFQAEEIEAARLKAGEDHDLKQERDRLANAESLATLAQEALSALDEGTPEAPAASDLLGQVSHVLASLARIDSSQNELSIRAAELFENLTDLAQEVQHYLDRIEFNPKRLEQVEERLDLIHRLCRKYGGSIEAAHQVAVNARRELETITNATEKIAELETKEAGLLKKLAEQGLTLSKKRQEAAAKLGKQIEIELDDLKMASAKFGTDFQVRPDPHGVPLADGRVIAFDATGFDRVEFLVAPNPGEGLKPLAKIASGGETSRLMLALKNVLARADQVPTLIFDEIDQGIGGRVGGVVGSKLWNLGRSHQVMCITHLPQLAAYGDQHFQVQKVVKKGRTSTDVRHIDGEDRMLELALMLGEVSEGTLQSASEIMQSARAAMSSASR